MTLHKISQALIAAAVLASFSISDAFACSDRPGTPNEERAVAISDTEIEYSWRVTTNGPIWYDIYIHGPTGNFGRNATGIKGLDRQTKFGRRDRIVYDQLTRGTQYCFSIRARTEANLEGCVSRLQSSWQCATPGVNIRPPPAPPPPPAPSPVGTPKPKCCWAGSTAGTTEYICHPKCGFDYGRR